MAQGLKQKLDYGDLAHTPDDGRRYELLEGALLVSPSARPLHQRVSKRLQRQREAYFEDKGLGEVFDAPVDVILTMHDVVVPDLVVVTTPPQVTERAIEVAPALIVEILSPSTRARDRNLKAERYAALGVAIAGLSIRCERHWNATGWSGRTTRLCSHRKARRE